MKNRVAAFIRGVVPAVLGPTGPPGFEEKATGKRDEEGNRKCERSYVLACVGGRTRRFTRNMRIYAG